MAPSAVETVTAPAPTTVKPIVSEGDYKVIGTRRFNKEGETNGIGDFAPASVRALRPHSPYTYISFYAPSILHGEVGRREGETSDEICTS